MAVCALVVCDQDEARHQVNRLIREKRNASESYSMDDSEEAVEPSRKLKRAFSDPDMVSNVTALGEKATFLSPSPQMARATVEREKTRGRGVPRRNTTEGDESVRRRRHSAESVATPTTLAQLAAHEQAIAAYTAQLEQPMTGGVVMRRPAAHPLGHLDT